MHRVPVVLLGALVVVMVAVACTPVSVADGGASPKVRVCVADFRPDKNSSLSDHELDYCKMLQRAVEIEVGRYLSDAALAFGKTAYHLSYDLAPKAGGNVSFQFGIGGMTNTHESLGVAGFPDLTRKTKLSAYANGVLSMKNDMTANFGLWYLNQTGSVPAFTYTIPGGAGIPVSAMSATQSVLQWTLSFGRSF